MNDKIELPKVSVRFAEELLRMVTDELEFSVDGTFYKDDLRQFAQDLIFTLGVD